MHTESLSITCSQFDEVYYLYMHLHKALVLPLIVLAAVALGGVLYMFGGAAFHAQQPSAGEDSSNVGTSKNPVIVLEHGTTAANFDQRVNYRVTDADQLASLWQMLYPDTGPTLPTIDFSKYEVLAVFDGSHTTGGYDVQVVSVKDAAGARTITITHTAPGSQCVTTGALTSPFVIVQVKASTLPVTHIDTAETSQCP